MKSDTVQNYVTILYFEQNFDEPLTNLNRYSDVIKTLLFAIRIDHS